MSILVDKLSFDLLFLLKGKVTKEIIYLDPATIIRRAIFAILQLFGISSRELEFTISDDEWSGKTNLYSEGLTLAHFLAVDISREITKNGYLQELNEGFGRNTLRLHLAKCCQHELLEFCMKIVFLQKNSKGHQRVVIQKPYFISWEYVENSGQFEGIEFYSSTLSDIKAASNKLYSLIKLMLIQLYNVLRSRIQPVNLSANQEKNIILSPSEDTISLDPARRNQQFWTLGATENVSYYVLKDGLKFKKFASVSFFGNTKVISPCTVGMALRKHSRDPRLDTLRRSLVREILLSVLIWDMVNYFAYMNILILFKRGIEVGSVALFLKVTGYVFKETHRLETDAVQLVSGKIGVTTYAIQYSNLVRKNCLMKSTADKFLIFSDIYKSTFSDESFSPGEFVVTGYPYREVVRDVEKSAKRIKTSLNDSGVSFIIGYFDETMRPGKYAEITKEIHRHEILLLAHLVLAQEEIAVIVKSQFIRHSTALVYKSDKIIQEALATGRLLDLCQGDDVRNNVYPAEVACASDICIGNAVGATASLEAALCGTRSVMVNPYKVEATWTHLLGKNIVFSNLEDCLINIQGYDRTDLANSNLGDWSSVIRNFDPYVDEFSFRRIQSVIL
ncbi:hypothetical protein OAB62_06130 [Pseudomonadales bacterium]|nr:hypothetical protein [Pseudomonadales bacterium]